MKTAPIVSLLSKPGSQSKALRKRKPTSRQWSSLVAAMARV
jgi:hypothetical protein